MKSGFDFELYETLFTNCFIFSSRYENGNLQLSLFGTDPATNETAHFADITLNQNSRLLKENEIVVDFKYKPTMIPQLINLGILKEQVGICIIKDSLYPIYTIDRTRVNQKQYCMQELVAA